MDSASELCLGGERGAPVKIEVFSDYQCPRCRDFYLETLKPLVAEYTKSNKTNKIYIVYHDFPLEMHRFARRAACFALAAARLGRERWLRVTDLLYTQQAQWSEDGNIEAVLAQGMDPTEVVRLANMAADPAIDAAVQDELLLGQSREVTSTPTFYIIPPTGPPQRVAGWVNYATLKDYLDRILK
jgi:protein-disulfide isomerase